MQRSASAASAIWARVVGLEFRSLAWGKDPIKRLRKTFITVCHSTAVNIERLIMAILLRNTQTGFFYVGYNRWRVYPEEAFDFQTMERANQWIDAMQLDGVEIVHVPMARAVLEHRQTRKRSH
jgi:hypothetical protein